MDGGHLTLDASLVPTGQGLVVSLRALEQTVRRHCRLLEQQSLGRPSPGRDGGKARDSGVDEPLHCESATANRRDKVTVFVRVVFVKVGEIDTLKETFMADVFIQAKWREPRLDGRRHVAASEANWNKYWNPKLFIENTVSEPSETTWTTVCFSGDGKATMCERRRVKGCFLENLELDQFPFDTQDLTLTVTSERWDWEVVLEEDERETSSVNVDSFVDEQEWRLHRHTETVKTLRTSRYRDSPYKHPSISAYCRASRRPGFYIWNLFLVMMFICGLAFATFSVDCRLPQNRLQLSFLLLLTTITFKFVVSQTLPRISYLTYLDKYILISMAILCSVCVWHSLVPLLHQRWDVTVDRYALAVLGGAYILFHVVFTIHVYCTALKKRWKYSEEDRQHGERLKKTLSVLDTEESI